MKLASTPTTHDSGYPFPFFELLLELQHCVYRFVLLTSLVLSNLNQRLVFEAKDSKNLSIALFLINKQIHKKKFRVLYQYSHFLILINSHRASCVARESPILWRLDQMEAMDILLADSI